MVGAGVGDVERADAVGQDADALALQSAQHGARGVGAERRGRNAGGAIERLADGRADRLRQFLPLQDRHARDDVGTVAVERGGHDDLRRRLGVSVTLIVSGGCGGLLGHGGRGNG